MKEHDFKKQSQSFDKLRTSFWKSQVDTKLIISRDYEKYIYCEGHLVSRRRISKNKPKQSQFSDDSPVRDGLRQRRRTFLVDY